MDAITRRGFLSGAIALTSGAVVGQGLAGGAGQAKAAQAGEDAGAGQFYNPTPQDDSWTSYTTDYADLFSPITVGPLNLKNRLVKSSAGSDTTNKEEKAVAAVSQAALEYYTRIAKGGVAAIVLEADTLSHLGFAPNTTAAAKSEGGGKAEGEGEGEGTKSGYASSSVATQDEGEQIAAARVLSDAIHEHGCYVLYRFRAPGTGIVDNDVAGKSKEFLEGFFQSVGDCARKLKEAGFDGVEIKAATTDISSQFLSLKNNTREDEYGPQSLENRARIMTEQVRAIREAAGDDFAVFTVLNACEENDAALGDTEGYLSFEECAAIAKLLEAAGADEVQVRAGGGTVETSSWAPDNAHAGYKRHGMTGYGTRIDYSVHWNGMECGSYSGVGAFFPATKALKQEVSIPVGCASADPRLAPDLVNNAVRDGLVDLVFVNRCIQADFDLPNKLAEGRRDEVAPCCRCLHCHTAGLTPKTPERCRVNAALQVAYRASMPEGYDVAPAEVKKRVLVVGGGPAGMEAARIAAQRGHDVSLYEKGSSLGGLLAAASAYKGEHEALGDLVAYLARQQELCGVDVHLDTEVTADLVRQEAPDAVVIAVGGKRPDPTLAGNGSVNVVGIDDVAFSQEIGARVAVVGAGAQAIDMGQWLLAQGKSVTFLNPGVKDDIDKEQSLWFRRYLLPDLYASGVKIWNQAQVEGLAEDGLAFTSGSDGVVHRLACDTVVEAQDMVANDGLAKELEGFCEVVCVGDCTAPFNIQQAISSGNLAARAL